jgi:hypothetical protein
MRKPLVILSSMVKHDQRWQGEMKIDVKKPTLEKAKKAAT